MMLCGLPLHVSQKMQDFTFYVNIPTFFHCLFFSTCLRVDIVVMVDDVQTLVDIVIIDSN
jgi:hypothetical protein